MIDTNLLNNASNILVQAGYVIHQVPATVPESYINLATTIVTACLSILAVITAWGRAAQAWSTGHSAVKAIVSGTNTPATPTPPTEPKV